MKEKYQTNGYVGLANLGNTCFLNSCLQILNHTYELNAYLDSKKYDTIAHDIPDTIILREWDELRQVMWSENGTVSPNRFVYHVQQIAGIKDRDIFTGWAQNDLSEFLYFLIDCMHNSIARKINMRITGTAQNNMDTMALACYGMLKDVYSKEYSEIMDLFYAIHVSEIKSIDETKVYSTKPEHFFILNLEINTAEGEPLATLADCFDHFTTAEVMSGENAWYNENTGKKQSAIKKMSFWSFPKILVIMLKRFSADGERKLNQHIQFPLCDLDLSRYVRGYNADNYVYDLYGVCNHMGNIMGGHYTSFVKNNRNQWIHFNDTHVDLVSPDTVVSPMAYTLFYRRRME
jgi:ubiquitin carboxyl-terminal hydrolase 8